MFRRVGMNFGPVNGPQPEPYHPEIHAEANNLGHPLWQIGATLLPKGRNGTVFGLREPRQPQTGEIFPAVIRVDRGPIPSEISWGHLL
jgi:hypothetical protein